MNKVLVGFVLVLAALVAASCGANLEKAVVGKFKLVINSDKMAEKDKAMIKMVEPMLKDASLEMTADHKAIMNGPGGQKQTGTWKLDGTTITVTDDNTKKEEKMLVADGGKKLVPDKESLGMGDTKGAEFYLEKVE